MSRRHYMGLPVLQGKSVQTADGAGRRMSGEGIGIVQFYVAALVVPFENDIDHTTKRTAAVDGTGAGWQYLDTINGLQGNPIDIGLTAGVLKLNASSPMSVDQDQRF